MKNITVLFALIICFIGCNQQPSIAGIWERYGDEAEGSMVKVELVGKEYIGRLIKVEGALKELGFADGDIKWRSVKPIAQNKWDGQDLIKVVDYQGVIQSVDYKDVYFTLLPDGALEVRKFAKETEVIGTVQKWRRIE
jgi:hypothetical protein